MFALTEIVGYTQTLVFVIVRLIVTGSLAGRLFANDANNLNCSMLQVVTSQASDLADTMNYSTTNIPQQLISDEVKCECLKITYHGAISPLTAWAFTIFSAVLPWLLMLPWIPIQIGRNVRICPFSKFRWLHLSLFYACLIRACMRFCLELSCFIGIIVAYKMYIPPYVTCNEGTVFCEVAEYEEKTYFLWILTFVNLVCALLTVWEILHMFNHRDRYEIDEGKEYVFDKIHTANGCTESVNKKCDVIVSDNGCYSDKGSEKRFNTTSFTVTLNIEDNDIIQPSAQNSDAGHVMVRH